MSVQEAARRLAPTVEVDEDHDLVRWSWLAEVAPDVVTVSGAVGFGHLPAAAFEVLAGPSFTERGRREGVHRRTGAGERRAVHALVLERSR